MDLVDFVARASLFALLASALIFFWFWIGVFFLWVLTSLAKAAGADTESLVWWQTLAAALLGPVGWWFMWLTRTIMTDESQEGDDDN